MAESRKELIFGDMIDYIWRSFHTMAPKIHNLLKAKDPLIL